MNLKQQEDEIKNNEKDLDNCEMDLVKNKLECEYNMNKWLKE